MENWKTFFVKILALQPPKKDDNNAGALMELIQYDKLTDSRCICL